MSVGMGVYMCHMCGGREHFSGIISLPIGEFLDLNSGYQV